MYQSQGIYAGSGSTCYREGRGCFKRSIFKGVGSECLPPKVLQSHSPHHFAGAKIFTPIRGWGEEGICGYWRLFIAMDTENVIYI